MPCMRVHARAIRGDCASEKDVANLVATHLHTPFAHPVLRERLEAAATRVFKGLYPGQSKGIQKH